MPLSFLCVEFSLTSASSLPDRAKQLPPAAIAYQNMPLDLVRGIDDALAELVDWRTRKLRIVNRDASPSEREAWLWSGLPTKPVDQICRLLLSPVPITTSLITSVLTTTTHHLSTSLSGSSA